MSENTSSYSCFFPFPVLFKALTENHWGAAFHLAPVALDPNDSGCMEWRTHWKLRLHIWKSCADIVLLFQNETGGRLIMHFFFPASYCSARLMFPFKCISILISPAEDQPPYPAWAKRHRVIGRSPRLEKRREGNRRVCRWIKFADSVSKEVKKEWIEG